MLVMGLTNPYPWQFPSPGPKLRGGKMIEIKRATDHGEGSVYIDGHLWGAPVAVLDKLDRLEARIAELEEGQNRAWKQAKALAKIADREKELRGLLASNMQPNIQRREDD